MRTEIFTVAARVQDGNFFFVERPKYIIRARQNLPPFGSLEICRFWANCLGCGRSAHHFPRLNTAIQHPNIRVTEELQEPKSPRGSHAGVFLVEDHLFIIADAAQFKDMMDHVHECLERRFPCVNQAETKKIKMDRARNVTLSKLFRRPHVDQTEVRCAEFFLQFSRCCEERFSRVFFFHIAPITLLKMTLQIMRSRTSLRAL